MKKIVITLCVLICMLTLAACGGLQKDDALNIGINAIITEINTANKIITVKDSGEEGILGEACLVDCSKIPMIYCNYDTQQVESISFDDLQVGDEIILSIRSSEINNFQNEDINITEIEVEQLQLSTQRIK